MIANLITFIKNFDFKVIAKHSRPFLITALCLTGTFIAGFGVGYNPGNLSTPTKRLNNTNYNTNKVNQANTVMPANVKAQATTINTSDCKIKGSKSKIYHVPGGAFYNRTTPAICFQTEEEAQTAGYTKSSR